MHWNIQPNFLRAKALCRLCAAKTLPKRSVAASQNVLFNMHLSVHPTHKQSQGFTLIELLAVITLLGLLAVVAVTYSEGVVEESNVRITKVEMSELRKALRQFKRDVRHFPDEKTPVTANQPNRISIEQNRIRLLVECTDDSVANPESFDEGCQPYSTDTARGWHGPYVLSEGIADSWGSPYRLSYENLEPRLISSGENKQYEGDNEVDRCIKKDIASDDIVLCLLK